MSGYQGPPQEWCPPELTDASRPLLRTKELLRTLSDDKRGLERFADRGPDPDVADAFHHFVEAWDLALWKLSGTAGSLGDELRRCAEDYLGSEADLSRRIELARGDHEGWRR